MSDWLASDYRSPHTLILAIRSAVESQCVFERDNCLSTARKADELITLVCVCVDR